jgi:hypothetical protein
MRTSCLANQTLLIRLNSSEAGAAPHNSHAQLANFSGSAYPYSVCCWTDSFRTLNNTCGGNGIAVVKLFNVTDSHVQAGNMTGYVYSACMNVTSGNITCEYPNNACTAGFNGVMSIASSETADANLTNAHVGNASLYYRKVCCQIGAQNPPTIAYVNISPVPNATTRQDLECQNGTVSDLDGDSVTLHYNWYRNGTSITVLNLPMDFNGTHTHDISGYANHGTVNNNTQFSPTGGAVGGAFSFNGFQNNNITIAPSGVFNFSTNNFSISAWISPSDLTGTKTIIQNSNSGNNAGFLLYIVGGTGVRFTTTNDVSQSVVTIAGLTMGWHHVVAVRNDTSITLYLDTVAQYGSGTVRDINSNRSITISGTANPFNGSIDEVIVFNRSLTASEVATLYATNNRFFNSTETRRNDYWNCSITPVDSTGLNGSTKYSNRTNITGSVPSNITLLYPVNNNLTVFERFLNFSWTAADERDGDSVTYTLNTSVSGGSCGVQLAPSGQAGIALTNYTHGELCLATQYYNWTVDACDVDGCTRSAKYNFSVPSVVGIQFLVNLTQFGMFNPGQSKATDADGIAPFVINNTGNVKINVSVNGTSPFTSASLPTGNYTVKAGVNRSNAYNETGSVNNTYTMLTTTLMHLIKQLNYTAGSGANSTAAIHMNITAPEQEPPGNKQGNLTVLAEAAS